VNTIVTEPTEILSPTRRISLENRSRKIWREVTTAAVTDWSLHALDDREPRDAVRVHHCEDAVGGDRRLVVGRRPASDLHPRRPRGSGLDAEGVLDLDSLRAHAVPALGKRHRDEEALARPEPLLGDDVGGDLRTADAEFEALDPPHGGVGHEGEFDRLVEVHGKVDSARLAVRGAGDPRQLAAGLLRAAAMRAEHLPAQVEHPRARGMQEEIQCLAPVGSPRVRELVGAHL
jgi:hypothetical protein